MRTVGPRGEPGRHARANPGGTGAGCRRRLGRPGRGDRSGPRGPRSGCGKDTDCKGDRICVIGACQEPPSR